MVDLTRIYYYHCDHLGTPQELSNSMAQVVWQGQYKVWGELVADKQHTTQQWAHENPSVQQLIENSEIITNNLRFQGQYFDLETGLHYNRYRYYSPEVGRFISKDPIGLLGGLNGYAYAPNPIGWVDPLGLNRNKNPNNWLQHHEGGNHHGHTMERHVGKSDCYLRNRLQQKKPKVFSSSTYPNQQIAENTISKAFKQIDSETGKTNREKVKTWSKTADKDEKFVIKYKSDQVVGRGIKSKNNLMTDKTNANVVLKSDGKGKYSILTSYPN